jgi:hypothetical protein
MARRLKTKTRKQRGRGYGFGGSILSDAGGANAGNVAWNRVAGECGMPDRAGNNSLAGGRRRRKQKKTRKLRGGMMALQQPRAGYMFTGQGSAGMADAVPSAPVVTRV